MSENTKVVVMVISILFIAMCVRGCNGDGIIIHPSFEYGVAMCDGGEDVPYTPQAIGPHMWREKGISYTVNRGYMGDEGVKHLKVLATIECAPYFIK